MHFDFLEKVWSQQIVVFTAEWTIVCATDSGWNLGGGHMLEREISRLARHLSKGGNGGKRFIEVTLDRKSEWESCCGSRMGYSMVQWVWQKPNFW